MTEMVPVRLPTGQIVDVPAKEAAALQRGPASVATPEDVRAKALEDTYGGLAGHATALGIGAGNAATGGLFTRGLMAVSELAGGDVSAGQEAIRRSLEVNPGTETLGELAGLGLSGGAAEGGLGHELSTGLRGGLAREGAGALERFAVRGLGGAAQGVADQAQIDIGHQVTEDALGNVETNASRLLAAGGQHAGMAALLGGAAEGAFGLIPHGRVPGAAIDDAIVGVEGAGRGVRRDMETTSDLLNKLQDAGVQTRDALGDLHGLESHPTAIGEEVRGYAKMLHPDNPEAQQAIIDHWRLGQQSELERAALIDKHVLSIADDGTTSLVKGDATVKDVAFKMKDSQFKALVDEELSTQGRDATIRMWEDARDTIDGLKQRIAQGDAMGATRGVKPWLKQADALLENFTDAWKASGGKSNAEMMMRADDFKRGIGKLSGFGKESLFLSPQENAFAGLYDRTRAALEDPAAWGDKAATAQRELNASHTAAINKRDALLAQMAANDGTKAGLLQRRFDTAKVASFLNDIGSAASRDKEALLQDYLTTSRNQMDTVEKHLALDATEKAALSESRTALDRLEKSYLDARKDALAVQRVRSAAADEAGRGVGGLLGFATDAAFRPHVTLDRLATAKRLVDRVDRRLGIGVKKLLRGEGKASSVSPFAAGGRKSVQDALERVRELAANPEGLAARAQAITGEFAKLAPKHAGAIGVQFARGVGYLDQNAPSGAAPHGLAMMTSKRTAYSDQQLSEFHEQAKAVLDPVGTIEAGKLSLRQVQAIRASNPPLYEDMQRHAQEEIAQMAMDGTLETMPYQQRLMLAIVLQVPADETMTPEFIQAIQATKQQPAPGAQGSAGGGAPKPQGRSLRRLPADNMQTSSQRLEGVIK